LQKILFVPIGITCSKQRLKCKPAKNEKKVNDAEKGNAFFCPVCKTELILRKSGKNTLKKLPTW